MNDFIEAGMMEAAYERGKKDERATWTGYLQPETIEITVRVRDAGEQTNHIRAIVTFDQFKASRGKILKLQMEETFGVIVTADILRKLVETL